jgi:carboxyl-terminal processing protease
MVKKIAQIKFGIIIGPFFLLCLAVGFAWASSEKIYTFIRLFDRIALTVSDKYVESLDPEKLIKASIDGMLDKLDSYSQYLSGQDYYYLLQETQGEYSGIGIIIEKHLDTLWVESVIEGNPAHNVNIKVGDRILMVDTIDVVGKSRSDCIKLLRGQKGTPVNLQLRRPLLGKNFNIELTRDKIHIDPVPFFGVNDDNNGYIRISRFSEGSANEVKKAISRLLDKNINGLIVDLRGNPGGLLYEAVETSALFLKKGKKIVEVKGRGTVRLRSYESRTDGIYNDGPLVVVIDNKTASAAEILAGAVQDHDRGIVIGSTSYGKGLVQQILQFTDNSALKLTTAKYYTPSNRCIQKDTNSNNLILKDNSRKPVLFYTNSGRPVFSGGGIIPDIYVDPLEKPPLLDELVTLGYVNDFISEYCTGQHVDEDFEVTDKMVDSFFEYLKARDYVYHNPVCSAFDRFVTENGVSDKKGNLNDHVKAIKDILFTRSNDEMISLRLQIKDLLYDCIIVTCLGKHKSYELVWLKRHPELTKAREVLNNPDIYSNLLAGF